MDVHNSKDGKEGVIFCTKEEEELEKLARSPKSGCSCSGSPPLSPESENKEEPPILTEKIEAGNSSYQKPKNFAGAILAN